MNEAVGALMWHTIQLNKVLFKKQLSNLKKKNISRSLYIFVNKFFYYILIYKYLGGFRKIPSTADCCTNWKWVRQY